MFCTPRFNSNCFKKMAPALYTLSFNAHITAACGGSLAWFSTTPVTFLTTGSIAHACMCGWAGSFALSFEWLFSGTDREWREDRWGGGDLLFFQFSKSVSKEVKRTGGGYFFWDVTHASCCCRRQVPKRPLPPRCSRPDFVVVVVVAVAAAAAAAAAACWKGTPRRT